MKYLLIWIILVISFSLAIASEEEEYPIYEFSSIAEVLEFQPGSVPINGLMYLIQKLSLPWEIELDKLLSSYHDGEWIFISHVSGNCKYCILARIRFLERGPYGNAEYCLFNSTGRIIWKMNDFLVSRPRVSNNGHCAVISVAERNKTQVFEITRFLLPVTIKIVDLDGNIIKSRTWDTHIRRPGQSRYFKEKYEFTPDGELFISTMNIESEVPIVVDSIPFRNYYDNSELYIYNIELDKEYQYYLGYFDPRALQYDCNDNTILKGRWSNSKFDGGWVGNYLISNAGESLEKRVIYKRILMGD